MKIPPVQIEDQPEEDSQLAKRALAYIFCARRPLKMWKSCAMPLQFRPKIPN
jgi:hypothetical protein